MAVHVIVHLEHHVVAKSSPLLALRARERLPALAMAPVETDPAVDLPPIGPTTVHDDEARRRQPPTEELVRVRSVCTDDDDAPELGNGHGALPGRRARAAARHPTGYCGCGERPVHHLGGSTPRNLGGLT